jgi:hypothetical protein
MKKKHIIGIHFSKEQNLPKVFIKSALKNADKDVELTLYTNFEKEDYGIQDKRLKIIPVKAVLNDTYRKWKDIAESDSSGKRWYRILSQLLRILSIFLIRNNRPIPDWLVSFLFTRYAVHVARFFVYWNHLLRSDIERCLYSDVTDVLLQGDVFESPIFNNSGVFAFEERLDIKIGNEEHNNAWIKKLYYDYPIYKNILESVICCSGTIVIIGRKEVLEFMRLICLEQLTERMSLYPPGSRASGNAFGMTHGHNPADQGVYNYLITRYPKMFNRIPNGETIYTMGTERDGDFEVMDGKIKKKGKETPSVVHQYNRHAKLNELVEELY